MFPNATRTNLVMTTNLRALIHMCGLRLCTMAQWEIRRLFQLIRHEIFGVSPFLGSFLAPKGPGLRRVSNDEHCPIRPHKDNVLAAGQKRDAANGCPTAPHQDDPLGASWTGKRGRGRRRPVGREQPARGTPRAGPEAG